MSYNIDTHHVVAGGPLTLTGRQIVGLRAAHEDEFPEDCLFYDLPDEVEMDGVYEIDPSWRAMGSGNSFDDIFLAKILPETKGSADIVYTWEGGDSFSGIRVCDGVVTKHEVLMTLGKQEE